MKKILLMPVKNEEWILEKTLSCASLWADHIVLADNGSTDRTKEIAKSFNKVVFLEPGFSDVNQSFLRQYLLDFTRRQFQSENLIFCLDADEILTANCLKSEEFDNLLVSLKPGQSVILQWLMLWGKPSLYRADNSVWGDNWKQFVFYDDGKGKFENKKLSEPRVPEIYLDNSIKCGSVKVLHYQFVDWDRAISKQCRYQVHDWISGDFSFLKLILINNQYFEVKNAKNDINTVLKIVPHSWVDGYLGVDLSVFQEEKLFWRDVDILEIFKKFGTVKFRWLDIWHIDWEKKRKLALKSGGKTAFASEIKDPRGVVAKLYHKHLRAVSLLISFLRLVRRVVLPKSE